MGPEKRLPSWKLPLGLAALSIVPAWLLVDGVAPLGIAFWTVVAAVTGVAINAAIAAFRRHRRLGAGARSIRAGLAIMAFFIWCLLTLVIAAVSWQHLFFIKSSEYHHPRHALPGAAATLVLLAAGALGACSGAGGLAYLQRPSPLSYRATVLLGFSAIAAIFGWSMISYGPFSAADAQSHAVGAAFGTFLVVIVLPFIAVSCVLVQLLLLRSLRSLINIDVLRENPA